MDVINHNVSGSEGEGLNQSIIAPLYLNQYSKVHQRLLVDLRTLAGVLHYNLNLNRIFMIGVTKQRTTGDPRDALSKKIESFKQVVVFIKLLALSPSTPSQPAQSLQVESCATYPLNKQ